MAKQQIDLSTLSLSELGSVPLEVLSNYNNRLEINFNRQKAALDTRKVQLAQKVTTRQKVGNGSLLTPFSSGNLNDINRIIWPFAFSSDLVLMEANSAPIDAPIGISAEADFVATHMTVAVYEVVDLGGGNSTIRYIDRESQDSAMVIQGLKLLLSDSQSTRQWMQNPVNVQRYGDGQRPYYFDEPQLIEKNSNVKVTIFNNSTRTYILDVVLHGYRIRIEDVKEFYNIVNS